MRLGDGRDTGDARDRGRTSGDLDFGQVVGDLGDAGRTRRGRTRCGRLATLSADPLGLVLLTPKALVVVALEAEELLEVGLAIVVAINRRRR